jgi:hypothetical protein
MLILARRKNWIARLLIEDNLRQEHRRCKTECSLNAKADFNPTFQNLRLMTRQ